MQERCCCGSEANYFIFGDKGKIELCLKCYHSLAVVHEKGDDEIEQCIKCKKQVECEHKKKCEEVGLQVQVCKFYEES